MKKKVSLFLLLFGLMFALQASAECQHDWEEWIGDSPDCGYDAEQFRFCSICYEMEERLLPATGLHQWEDWFVSDSGGCTDPIEETRYCESCYTSESRELPAPGHNWGKWYTVKAATPFSTGLSERICSECEETEQKTTAKTKAKKASTKTEKNVTKPISDFFKYAKSYNTKQIKKCFKNPKKVSLFEKKKNVAKFYKTYNTKYLKYAYKSIKADKKKATVKVYCRYYDAYTPTIYAMDDMVWYILKNPRASSNTIDKKQYKQMCSYAKKQGVKYDTAVLTFNLVKSGKNWKISSYTKAMDNAIHGNYRDAYNDYFYE